MPAQIVHQLSDVPTGPHVVTVGNFDGVHRGHQFLLAEVRRQAEELHARTLVITFDPLPVEVLRPDHAPPRLTTSAERMARLGAEGVDVIVVVPFSREFASWEADQFVERVSRATEAVAWVVGADFRFGHNRSGSVDLLRELAPTYNYDVTVVERMGGEEISSTRARKLIAAGEVREAAELLGRPYMLPGVVGRGAGRGRHLGFPTANLTLPDRLAIPADGIYATLVQIDDRPEYVPGMAYIGTRPTFNEITRAVEVYLIDFQEDLYGHELKTLFIEKIRGDQQFDSAEALITQMRRDEEQTRRVLATATGGVSASEMAANLTIRGGADRGDG